MKKILVLVFCSIVLSATYAPAQGGFSLLNSKPEVEIPFEYTNNFMIVTLFFNGVLPLKFIFDTGAEHTILTKREIADVMRVPYEREFRILGSDMKTELVAYLARRVRFDLPDKAVAPKEDILVLQEDYFRFEEYAGVEVHGILSASVFSKFIVKINYQRKTITLYDREDFKLRPKDGFVELPLEMFRNKPYINTHIQITRDSVVPVKLLVDTGAGLPLMLFTDATKALKPPPNAIPGNIGMGLGGYLEGYHGRIHQLALGSLEQKEVVSYFQQMDSTANRDYVNQRNGLFGNVILSRFIVILDYQEEKMWLKPTKSYQEEYDYDRSGLNIIVSGAHLNTFLIQNVLPGSPADKIGLQKGDRIKRIGYRPAGLMTLSNITRLLSGKSGKKHTIVVKRDGKRLKKTITLEDLL